MAITRLHIVRLRRSLEFGGIIARIQRLGDEMSNFKNPTWWTAAILKIIISPYLSRKSSEFDEIRYADANFDQGDGNERKFQKLANSKWRMDASLKITFWL